MTEQNPHDHCQNCEGHATQPVSSNPLDSIKNEISAKLNDQNKKSLPWNNIMVTAVLGVLTLVSVVQTAGAFSVLKKLQGNPEVNASTGVPQNSSLEALPDMVGGC